MPLRHHLREARQRLSRSAAAFLVAAVAGWFFQPMILAAMRTPVISLGNGSAHLAGLNYSTLTGAFDLRFQIALTAGAVLSSPVWLYQLFAFVMPGLEKREKRYVLGFFAAALPLFVLGCASGWYVFPHIVGVLLGLVSSGDSALVDAPGYYGFVLRLVLVVGIAFVVPVLLVALNFLGLVSARGLGSAWRTAVLVIVLFTAVATPSADVMSMFLLAIPMMALYGASIGVAWLHDRAAARKQREFLTPGEMAA